MQARVSGRLRKDAAPHSQEGIRLRDTTSCSYIIQDVRPAFQGDALEDSQDANPCMVEHGDAIVGRLALQAYAGALALQPWWSKSERSVIEPHHNAMYLAPSAVDVTRSAIVHHNVLGAVEDKVPCDTTRGREEALSA